MIIMDVDLQNKFCGTTLHPHGDITARDMTCSDKGKAYFTYNSKNVKVYKVTGAPETWSLQGNTIRTVAINKNYIAVMKTATRFIYVYDTYHVYQYKIENEDPDYYLNLPTSFKLDAEQIKNLVQIGPKLLKASPQYQCLIKVLKAETEGQPRPEECPIGSGISGFDQP